MAQNPTGNMSNMMRAMQQGVASAKTGIAAEAKNVGLSFKEGSTTNKVAVLGGISSGITFALQGVRNIRSGLTRDAKTGKRDLGTTAVGAVETMGGLFLTGVFYTSLRRGNEIFAPNAHSQSRGR